MQADLARVSLLNFWAPWAEPCGQMNAVVEELAAKYPQLLVLMIEAESLPDVSESFDIDSVPSFVLLRGHTLLSRISGANAAALSAAVASHAAPAATGANAPLSSTNAPAPAPGAYDEHHVPAQETQEELEERCRKLMERQDVMLFMKGNPDNPKCGFSQKTVALLRQEGVRFGSFDILQDEAVRQGLKKLNDWPTFPQIVVKGELIGGLDILKEQIETGEFRELLEG
ncbi:glutaredoxin [Tilletiopsis washingtonensis]|uniref:Glutaredoxin n=1 Tax=Tilletiopsis washingtonensis TaxID=58919 RepID=A0A316Z5H9_9BASI|nr:glutaredoxin [Tilletiopsis washingtonensis]PWN97037.1 glutaredoxin [Tilletiopsis washingtonensis]